MQGYLISVLGKAQMFFGRHFLMAAAGSKNVSQSDANNVLETAGEVTAEATEEVNRFFPNVFPVDFPAANFPRGYFHFLL